MALSLVRKDPQYAEGVEVRPELDRHFESSVGGLHIIGAANGSPLLKTCINEGVQVVRAIARALRARPAAAEGDGVAQVVDVLVVGAGPGGVSAALEARRRGLSVRIIEKSRPFNTIHLFPQGKHVYAEPATLRTLGGLPLEDSVKEELLARWGEAIGELEVERGVALTGLRRAGDLLRVQLAGGGEALARRVVLAIGRMGTPRRLGVPGEDRPEVFSVLLNPGKYQERQIVVLGGGNSAAEAALALLVRNSVTLVHRRSEFPRLSAVNRRLLLRAEEQGRLQIRRATTTVAFEEGHALVHGPDGEERLPTDAAFVLIGGTPPTALLRALGVRFEGTWLGPRLVHLLWVAALVYTVYGIKFGLAPFAGLYATLMRVNLDPGFLYGLLYSVLLTVFGLRALHKYRHDPTQRRRYGFLIAFQWIVYFGVPWSLYYVVHYSEWWRVWGVTLLALVPISFVVEII